MCQGAQRPGFGHQDLCGRRELTRKSRSLILCTVVCRQAVDLEFRLTLWLVWPPVMIEAPVLASLSDKASQFDFPKSCAAYAGLERLPRKLAG